MERLTRRYRSTGASRSRWSEAVTDEATVAVRQPQEVGLDAPGQDILSIDRIGEVERIEQTVVIPPQYQYSINRWSPGTGSQPKVMLTSEAYAYLNRVMGVELVRPQWTHDRDGKLKRNPIRQPGYILVSLMGIFRNDLGSLVSYREDVEVDFNLTYHDARINSKSAKVEMDADGHPVFENGIPKVTLDPADELKALKALSQLRTFGLRYAQTVAATRILRRVSGISTLPISQPRPFPVRVVGFRDHLTPDQRLAQAQQDLKAVFGEGVRLDEKEQLTAQELADIRDLEMADATDDLDHELISAAAEVEDMADERDLDEMATEALAKAKRVGPRTSAVDEGLGLDKTNGK